MTQTLPDISITFISIRLSMDMSTSLSIGDGQASDVTLDWATIPKSGVAGMVFMLLEIRLVSECWVQKGEPNLPQLYRTAIFGV